MTRMKFVLCCVCMLSVAGPGTPGFSQDGKNSDPKSAPETFESSSDSGGSERQSREVGTDGVPQAIFNPTSNEAPSAARRSGTANRRPRVVTRHVQEVSYEAIPPEEIEEAAKFKTAIQALKDAKGDDEKEVATHTIQELLQRQFQRDLKRREDDLAPVEQRVKALRQQLDKRREAMNDIISLRVKTILSNAEGLGFPDDDGLFDASAAEFATGHGEVAKPRSGSSSTRSRKKDGKPTKSADDAEILR